MYRILKVGSFCSHRIDLKDHLGGSLNNLRFSNKLWESQLMKNSGFYTNRLRASEIISIFEKTGFFIHSIDENKWNKIPIPRKKMHPEFHKFSESELWLSGI